MNAENQTLAASGPARERAFSPVPRVAVGFCLLFALVTAVFPFARASLRLEVGYNEGWNIYNTERMVQHLPLYPVASSWQTNNYPMLSYALLAFLHRITHEYLFTARAVSLLALLLSCGLVAALVHRLGCSVRATLLAGLFTLAVFCTNANSYVGMDDPQLLAQAVYLMGLVLYVRGRGGRERDARSRFGNLALVALVFVIAGNIKHNPIEFPLTVLIDLLFIDRIRALWFAACGIAIAALSVELNIHFGGPSFLAQMLASRSYSAGHLFENATNVLGPILIPVLIALFAAVRARHNPRQRIALIFLAASILVGSYFGGGAGVSINTLFGALVATSIGVGIFLDQLESGSLRPSPRWLERALAGASGGGVSLRSLAAPALFLWLLIPAAVDGILNPVASLRESIQEQARFSREVAFLSAHPAPQICESLLRCYFAGQPYLYDPFNATRLVQLHKLDPQGMVDGLRDGSYGAVELNQPLEDPVKGERFPTPILLAILHNYQPSLVDDSVIVYLPRQSAQPARQPASLRVERK